MHSVILHVLDKGVLLTVTESTGYPRRHSARQHAAKCAKEYASRYPFATVHKHVSDRWVISDKRGYSFAQFDVQ